MLTSVLAAFPSPSRGVWHLGPIPIRAYALCIIVGIIAALMIGDRRWAARGGERGVIYDIALWAVPFGLIGGRVYHLMTDWRTYFGPNGAGADAALRIWDGGLGIWGAIALGGVGAWIGCRRGGIPLPAFADAIAPGIVLAQAIGRLGNYFNQELYGRETGVPWGLQIFFRRDPSGIVDVHSLDGVSTGQVALVVQPTFLYELLWNLLVFVVLIVVDRRLKLGHGRLFALYVAAYCIGRFGVELLRDDPATLIYGIRVNSFTSTFVFIGAVVYMILAPKQREDPEVLRATWATAESEEEPAAVGADEDSVEGESGAELFEADVVDAVVPAAEDAEGESEPQPEDDGVDLADEATAEEAAADAHADEDEESEEPVEAVAEGEDVEDAEPSEVDEVAGEPEAEVESEPEPGDEELEESVDGGGEAVEDVEPSEVDEVAGEPEAEELASDVPADEDESEPEPGDEELEEPVEAVAEGEDVEVAEPSEVDEVAEEPEAEELASDVPADEDESEPEPDDEESEEPGEAVTDATIEEEPAAEAEKSGAEEPGEDVEDVEPSEVDELAQEPEAEVADGEAEEPSSDDPSDEDAESSETDEVDDAEEQAEPEPSSPPEATQARTRWWSRARRNRQ